MKILLVAVNAKYIHSNLAVYSLSAYAKKYSNNIQIAEYTINNSVEEILKGIYRENADVIAFSCYIWNMDIITRVVTELRKVMPEVKLWYGGPEVSYDAKECLITQQEIDGIVIGEGEQTFLELMEYYVEHNKDLDKISGIAFKESAKLYSGAKRASDESLITLTEERSSLSLNDLPFPYEATEVFQNKIIYYESSRGCPFSCSYCLSSIDKRVRLRDIRLVKKELQAFLDYQVPQVKFVDRTFNCNKKHAMEIWQYIKDHDNGITNFHFEIAADLLEDEEIALLNSLRPGQIQLEIGIQSTNPDTISAIHRKMNLEKLSENVRRIQQGHNIHQHLDLIAGLPLEDETAFAKSFNDVYRLKPNQLQLGFLKILKGSLMQEEIKTYGIVHLSTPPYEVLMTNHLDFTGILKLKGVCDMVEVYYNSGQFNFSIQYLEHFFETPMELYQELSYYYEKMNMDRVAHSRIRRYEILLNFYQELISDKIKQEEKKDFEDLFKELLIMDLYLREAMKSRPDFALSQNKNINYRDIYETYGTDRRKVHVEQFTHDLFASCKAGKPVKMDNLILFDYSNRDPLDKAAKISIIRF